MVAVSAPFRRDFGAASSYSLSNRRGRAAQPGRAALVTLTCEDINMIRQTLLLALLPIAVASHATCVSDPPEIGDIGPGSHLVCAELERQFPGAVLAVTGRAVHSPTAVSVDVLVDGQSMTLRYGLSGYQWQLDQTDARVADVPAR